MAKAINMRPNPAKTAVASDLNAKFNQGEGMANRQHPTDSNKKGQHHTTNDGTRA